jgi:hypothetical protein
VREVALACSLTALLDQCVSTPEIGPNTAIRPVLTDCNSTTLSDGNSFFNLLRSARLAVLKARILRANQKNGDRFVKDHRPVYWSCCP